MVSEEYEPLARGKINFPTFEMSDIPVFNELEVLSKVIPYLYCIVTGINRDLVLLVNCWFLLFRLLLLQIVTFLQDCMIKYFQQLIILIILIIFFPFNVVFDVSSAG